MNSDVMRPYTNQVLLLLLNRLQSKPSALFTQAFVYFMTLLSALESVGPDFVIQSLDTIQPGYVIYQETRMMPDV
jgi:exportin-2 (importin alpha re-exporter)